MREYIDLSKPFFTGLAPGRLDVMGGIADYSGSLVLQLPLDRVTTATLQPNSYRRIDLVTLERAKPSELSVQLDALLTGAFRDPGVLADSFGRTGMPKWGAYLLGVIHACLVRNAGELGKESSGFTLVIDSTVPSGKGISSSAALEVATFRAIASAFEIDVAQEHVARECQWAENFIARAPCGIMDQMTSACGQPGHLLRLRCQPATIEGHIAVPHGYRFFGIDSGIRHAVTGADYGTVRTAAFMGYRMIASFAGLDTIVRNGRAQVADYVWNGYLANIPPEQFTREYQERLPREMSGAEFLRAFGGVTDAVTSVDPARVYPVRVAATHPVRENARVQKFAGLLEQLPRSAADLGNLMYESHESYSACGLGSDGTDELVRMVKDAGTGSGLYGAKITGGGSGGTVAVLARTDAGERVAALAAGYERVTGRRAEIF